MAVRRFTAIDSQDQFRAFRVYDLNGNLLSKSAKPGVSRPDWSYRYDALDQLISVSRDGLEVERYRYDAFGRRSVIDTLDGVGNFERTAIVNDSSDRTIDLVQVDDGFGGSTTQIKNRYSHGGQVDEPLSLEVFDANGAFDQAYTYHADHLGSIRFVTDSVGKIVNAYEYDSYGRPGFVLEQVAQPFRYTAREYDAATELYHYRARQYDPETGRFLQEDPIGFVIIPMSEALAYLEHSILEGQMGSSKSYSAFGAYPNNNISLYRYVENNPINFIDSQGETPGATYSRLIKRSPKFVRNIDFHIRKSIGRLPIGRTGRIFDPRTGKFLKNTANNNKLKADKSLSIFQECIKAATDKSGSPPGGLLALFCSVAANALGI